MTILGLFMPVLAAVGWLWWIYESDHFEKEPWPLVLRTAAVGAATGLISFILLVPLGALLSAKSMIALAGLETALHLVGIVLPMYLLPYRNHNWNEPFDGLVYGGAVGIGYGLVYTVPMLLGGAELGFRVAIFSIPIFMMTGIIIGRFMSRVRFGAPEQTVRQWLQGMGLAALFLLGIDYALMLGAEVVTGRNMLAGLMAYAANMAAWMLATRAMDESHRASPFSQTAYELDLAPDPCGTCGQSYPLGAAYCSQCGRILHGAKEAQA